MNRNFLLGIVLLMFLLIGGFFFRRLNVDKTLIYSETNDIPEFNLNDLEFSEYYLPHLAFQKPLIFVFFNSNCSICKVESELIFQNFRSDNSICFVFISSEENIRISEFAIETKLNQLPMVLFLADKSFRLVNHFLIGSYPSILIFNKHGSLIDSFKGLVTISDLKRAIQKAHDSKP